MPSLSADQREHFLTLLRENRELGNWQAVQRTLAETGGGRLFKSECKRYLDAELVDDAREARGTAWPIVKIIDNLNTIATSVDHPQAVKAAEIMLNGPYGEPGWGRKSALELTGADGGPIELADRSASLDDVAGVLRASGAIDSGRDDPAALAPARLALAPPGDV